jgi:hypothetical protein
VLRDYEVKSHWELAPSMHGHPFAEPRLIVGLTLGCDVGTVIVRDARIVALEAAAFKYEAFLQLKDAPEPISKAGPHTIAIPGGHFDFGQGWAILPA